jgi:tetratricopeptide (TPR) repeat protein
MFFGIKSSEMRINNSSHALPIENSSPAAYRNDRLVYGKLIRTLPFLLLFFLFQTPLFSFPTNEEIFERGVTAYEERNFELALQSFLHLETEGIVNAELFYNIGNTYFRLDKLGYAVLYYKKGLKIQPQNKLLQNNLNYLLSLTQDRQTREADNPFLAIFHTVVYSLPLNTLLIITLVCFALIIMLINSIIIFYNKRDKTIPLFILTIIIILFFSAAVLSTYRWHKFTDNSEAVLLVSSTTGFSGPAEDYTTLFRIHQGMIFTVNRSGQEWSQITLPSGISGWIKNTAFQRVEL